jgi:hypothetical protein
MELAGSIYNKRERTNLVKCVEGLVKFCEHRMSGVKADIWHLAVDLTGHVQSNENADEGEEHEIATGEVQKLGRVT